jgi:zinc protease
VVHKPKASSGSLYFGQTGIVAQDPDRFSLGVANAMLGGDSFNSRLFKTIREDNGWTYSIFSTYNATGALTYQPGLFVIGATPSVEFTAKTILKTIEIWSGYLDKGLTNDELKLSRESIVNSYPFEFDSPHKRVSERLESYLYDVPLLTPDQFEKKVNGIDNSDIRKALKKRHDPKDWWIVVVADKDNLAKQLEEEQKLVPAADRITIAKVLTPDQVVD